MSKRTLSKLNRMYVTIPTGNKIAVRDGEMMTAEGQPQYKLEDERVTVRRDKVLPPTPRERVTFEWGGIMLSALVSPGQHINKEKAYKREMKRRELEWKNK